MIKATSQRGAGDLEGCLHIDGPMSVCVCGGGGLITGINFLFTNGWTY